MLVRLQAIALRIPTRMLAIAGLVFIKGASSLSLDIKGVKVFPSDLLLSVSRSACSDLFFGS